MRFIGSGVMVSCGTTLALLLAGPSGADPRSYANVAGEGDHFLLCSMDGSRVGVGGVYWPGGHIPAHSNGAGTIVIHDRFQSPASGFYCQDLDPDSICGGDADVPSGLLPTDEFELRLLGDDDIGPAQQFCGSLLIHSMPFAQPIWVPTQPVYVFLDGPANGGLLGPLRNRLRRRHPGPSDA